MIIITGGAGFIGNATIWKLNGEGISDIGVVDRLGTEEKWRNLLGKQFSEYIHKNDLFSWLDQTQNQIEAIIHLGACSSTTETDADYLLDNNTRYSMRLFNYCTEHQIPFIYASSAATYGNATEFLDSHASLNDLRPNNKYGFSKHVFDQWCLKQPRKPPFWYGMKFFNVFGPGESHKKGQTSVVYQAFHQIQATGKMKLFKSYHQDYEHGEQLRDFIYVKDVVNVIFYLLNNRPFESGIYNVGTGQSRSFKDLAISVFAALEIKPQIEWISVPTDIRQNYQYFTQANMNKLRHSGYLESFTTLEESVHDYVGNYLRADRLSL